jgi:5'-nucleotidase
MGNRPLILITNDDGYAAKGIAALVEMVRSLGDVVVVAPDSARSGAGCSFTPAIPLFLKLIREDLGVKVYACNGTPADCVKVALEHAVERTPDILLSGINHGSNASVNVHYSGTMGAVMEGCMKALPSVGFSLCDHDADADFTPLTETVREITSMVLRKGLPLGVCLNVNYPVAQEFRGIRVCRMTRAEWRQECTPQVEPDGELRYRMTGTFINMEPMAEDTDEWALNNGYVAITPTQMDVTAHAYISELKKNLMEQ